MTQLPPTHQTPSSVQPALLGRRSSLTKIGGSLGIAAVFISIAVFVVALFNFNAIFILAPLALVLSSIGMILSIIGGIFETHHGNEETQPLGAMFACLAGMLGSFILWWMRPH
jgi:hypothetical protein